MRLAAWRNQATVSGFLEFCHTEPGSSACHSEQSPRIIVAACQAIIVPPVMGHSAIVPAYDPRYPQARTSSITSHITSSMLD
jgi:hypothetical protein